MRVPCSSWARGFLRYRLGMTADHLVVRSTTGCDGWPPSATLCPKPVPGSKSTVDTPSTTRPNAPGGPSHGLVAKVRVAGSSPVVRSKALLRGISRPSLTQVEHHRVKVRVAGSSRDDAPVKPLVEASFAPRHDVCTERSGDLAERADNARAPQSLAAPYRSM